MNTHSTAASLLFVCAFSFSLLGQGPIQNAKVCSTKSGFPQFPEGYSAFSVSAGTAMRKHVITSPEATCNDGTPAVIYVRKAVTGATEPDGGPVSNRWMIVMQGGGSCTTYDNCQERWCGTGYYDASKMSSKYNPDAIRDTGILFRDSSNKVGNRNQIFAYYCSSDGWTGTKANSLITDPDDPTQSFTVSFKGSRIVDGILADLENGVLDLPKLTDATDIIFAGDSGGAQGVRHNIDRIAARLRQKNPNVKVRAVLEATFTIPQEGKSGKPPGDPTDPFTIFFRRTYENSQIGIWGAALDQSCLATHGPDTQFLCGQMDHLEKHHITTPFFQATDLADPGQEDGHLDPTLYPNTASMAQAQFDQLTGLANLLTTAEEKAQMTAVPGVVGRLCYEHVQLESSKRFFSKSVRTGPNAAQFSFYDVLMNWLFGGGPNTVIAPRPPATPENPLPDPICSQSVGAGTEPGMEVVSAASYQADAPVAPESLVLAIGKNVTFPSLIVAPSDNWPTVLGGVRVTVTDSKSIARPAQLYYVHPAQIAFLIPTGTAEGSARISVTGTTPALSSAVIVATASPGLYAASQGGFGVAAGQWVRYAANGTQTSGLLFDNTRTAVGVDLGALTDKVYLQVYGTGLRFATSGSVTVGGVRTPFLGPVAQGQFLGLDQLNIGPLPRKLVGTGDANIEIRANDVPANIVTVRIK